MNNSHGKAVNRCERVNKPPHRALSISHTIGEVCRNFGLWSLIDSVRVLFGEWCKKHMRSHLKSWCNPKLLNQFGGRGTVTAQQLKGRLSKPSLSPRLPLIIGESDV